MGRRLPSLQEQLEQRAVRYANRRGGGAIRRGGRADGGLAARGGSGGSPWADLFDPTMLYGISGFSAPNYFATQSGGGEAGVATGFGELLLVAVEQLITTAGRFILSRSNTGGTNGHVLWIDAANRLQFICGSGAAAAVISPSYQLLPSDLGKILAVLAWHDGTRVRLAVDSLPATVTGTAITGFTSLSTLSTISGAGTSPGTSPAQGVRYFGHLTFRGTPSDAQLQALYDAARVLGDVPNAFPLAMPTIYGARIPGSGAAGNYLSTPGGVRGGNVSGTWIGVWATISSITGDEAIISTTANSSGGYVLFRQGNRLAVGRREAVSYNQVHTYTFQESDIGRRMLFGLSHDGTTLRGWCDGTEAGSLVCTPIAAPTAAPMSVATSWSAYPTQLIIAPNLTTLGVVGGDGSVLTAGEWATLYADTVANGAIGTNAKATHRWDIQGAIAANGNVMPASVPDTIGSDDLTVTGTVSAAATGATVTHRWSLRDVLAAANVPVIDGQTAPAQLPDTVTAASVDAMVQPGGSAVKVKVIDPSIDGQKTYGVLGFSTTSYLVSSAPLLSGPTVDITVEVMLQSTAATQMLFSDVNGATGCGLFIFPANTIAVYSYLPNATVVSAAISSSDLGVSVRWRVTYDGATWRLYKSGVQVGSAAGTYAPSSGPMYIGKHPISSPTNFLGSIYRITIAGAHDYDLTQDVLANGGPDNGVPLQVLDRIGTDHLTKVGGLVVSNGGLTAFGASGYPQSATVASGLPGLVTGIWAEALIVVPPSLSAIETIFSNTGISSNGLNLRLGTDLKATARYGDGALFTDVVSPSALTAGEHHVATYYDGSAAHLLVDGSLVASSAAFVYAVGTQPAKIGTNFAGTSTPALRSVVKGVSGGHVVPTGPELAAASAFALANGRVGGIAGKTLRLYDIVQDVIDAGGKVPAIIRERVSGVDHMVVVGSPLQVAQRVERVWGYETTPILYGASGLTDADLFQSSAGAQGSPASFGGTIVIRPRTTTVSATRTLLWTIIGGNSGWRIRTAGTNATIDMTFVDGGGTQRASAASVISALANKIVVFSFQWDAPAGRLRVYLNRVETGTGTVITGYTPSTTGALRLGADGAPSIPATFLTFYGFTLWDGLASLAQIQASHDAILANDGRTQAPLGVAQTMAVDLTQNVIANGGAMPAWLIDSVGGNDLARIGAPTVDPNYARAFGW